MPRVPTKRRRPLPAIGVAVAIAVGLLGCHRRLDTTGESSPFPREQTLYIGGWQWGEPKSFNPLTSSPAWPIDGINLLYETLLSYDWPAGKLTPLLAESYTVGDDFVEVVLNPAARWNDGRPITGWDVKFTFDVAKKYKALRLAPIWRYLRAVELPEDDGPTKNASAARGDAAYPRRVVFRLDDKEKNPLVVLDALQEPKEAKIVPRHVIEPLLAKAKGDIEEVLKLTFDHDAVTSGPYRLLSYSSEKIILERDDAYWGNAAMHQGKLPAPKYIIHPIYKSGDHFSVALQQGRLDVSCTFVPRIWLKHAKGVRSWYENEPFFVSVSIPMFAINVTRSPLDDVAMRRAMAFAIDYRDIRELAVSGYSKPLKPGLIVPYGPEAKYFSEEDAEKYGAKYDPERAKSLLREAGYSSVLGPDGDLVETRDARGNKVPTVYLKSPTGWSDYESIVRIAVKSMRRVGIDARERFVDASLYWPALFSGDFDLIMFMTPNDQPTPSKPWSRFQSLLTAKEWAPEGQKAYRNYGRFNNPNGKGYNPRFDELLKLIPTLTSEEELTQAYRELNVLFMQYQPTLPVVYRPDQFFEVSVRHWENFPTAENPYLPPQIPGDRLGTQILWHLRPVASN